jgi:hypothetical protein
MWCSLVGSNTESASTLGCAGDGFLVFNAHNFYSAGIRYAHKVVTLVTVFRCPRDKDLEFVFFKSAPVAVLVSPYNGSQPLPVTVRSSLYAKRVTCAGVCASRWPFTSLSVVTKSGSSIIAYTNRVMEQH